MNSDSADRIKRRIRGLLNLAQGDGAAEGEISNAMRMAADLMAEHHISQADIEAEAAAAQACGAKPVDIKMGQADGACGTMKLSTWESVLSDAIESLVGSVKCYRTHTNVKTGSVFGATERRSVLRFYGPAEDAQLAAGLFDEWQQVIAAMAIGRYRGCWKGDGAMYAYGFAKTLRARAEEAAKARTAISTASTRAIVQVGSGTLADVLRHKQQLASNWLRDDQKVKLCSGGSRSGYSAGSSNAYAQGRTDGSRADFSVNRRHKLT